MSNIDIIATLGPDTRSEEMLLALKKAGVTIFRLNFSHGNHIWHGETIENIRKFTPQTMIMLDTKGAEIRTGEVEGKIYIEPNMILTFCTTLEEVDTDENILFVNHSNLPNDVEKGDVITLDSGAIIVEVLETTQTTVKTLVKTKGEIKSRRHLNVIGKNVSLPTITENDEKDIRFGLQNGIDAIALSFTRYAKDILDVRKICKEEGRPEVKIWAKIESPEGLKNLDEIINQADGIMVARGDLGVETPLEELPFVQIDMVRRCKKQNKFVIMATEMMESMIDKPRPTRAEATDVAMAVWAGADSLMLSGETASGKYPVETVSYMRKIATDAEKNPIKFEF